MRNIFLIKLSNIIIEKYQIIQYCSKINLRIYKSCVFVKGLVLNLVSVKELEREPAQDSPDANPSPS